jgi:hypothetical protein
MKITHEIEYRSSKIWGFIRVDGSIVDSVNFDVTVDPKKIALAIKEKIDILKRGVEGAEAVKAEMANLLA